MVMLKAQKVEFVKKLSEDIKKHKTVAVVPLEMVPDRLMQKVRNGLKPDAKFIVARKNLVLMALGNDKRFEGLKSHVHGNVALVLSDKDAAEVNAFISGNKLRLGAKPNQISPDDITIEAGETSIAPGQAVTDLKAAGIDVQIQKGKVVIGKSKVLVHKGDKISHAVSKALKMLEITPFEAAAAVDVAQEGNITFGKEALNFSTEKALDELARDFVAANALSIRINYVTAYNVSGFISRAFIGAVALGVQNNLYEKEIIDKVVSKAFLQALGLKSVAEDKKE